MDLVRIFIRYIIGASRAMGKEDVMEILEKRPPEYEEIRGTAAEEWLKEGFEAGEKKGEGRGRAEKRPQDSTGPGRRQILRASVQSGRKDRARQIGESPELFVHGRLEMRFSGTLRGTGRNRFGIEDRRIAIMEIRRSRQGTFEAWIQHHQPLSRTIVPAVVIPGGAVYNLGVDKTPGFRLFREFLK